MAREDFRSRGADPKLAAIMEARKNENREGFTLIASANHPHPDDIAAARDAEDATFEGMYAEGYPSPKGPKQGRYYEGTAQADALESMTRERVVQVFGAQMPQKGMELGSNVQVPTGAGVNLSVYFSLMKLGDRMVAPSLSHGYGHLSHGAESPNIVGKLFEVHGYGVRRETGFIDYEALEKLVRKKKPRMVVAGASSYPQDIDWGRIAAVANEVGAISMADISHPAGLIVAGLLKDPFSLGIDVVTSTTHKTLRGKKGAVVIWNREAVEKKCPEGSSSLAKANIDYGVFPGIWGGPNMSTIAAHASTFRRAQTEEFRAEQRATLANAAVLARVLKENGWDIITGGTANHLVLIDVTTHAKARNDATRDGWQAAVMLEEAGLVVNKNAIPERTNIRDTKGDVKKATPFRPAGIRLGTPAVTARGLGVKEVEQLGQWVHEVLLYAEDRTKIAAIRDEVRKMALRFPVPSYR